MVKVIWGYIVIKLSVITLFFCTNSKLVSFRGCL